jgi:superfamily I DNA/RNA helicase
MGDDRLLAGLDERQRQAVITPVSPLGILAGAGSGKTRVLTRRIAYQASIGRIEAGHTLALTFTRKAAGELTERLAALGLRRSGVRSGPATAVTAGTFHAVALAQLRRRWADRGEAVPALLERKVRLLVPFLAPGPSVASEPGQTRGLRGGGGRRRPPHSPLPGRGGQPLRALRDGEAPPGRGRFR